MSSSVKRTVYQTDDKRLVYFDNEPDSLYWDDQWMKTNADNLYHSALSGALGFFERWFTRYLPREGTIIEAGCGLAQFVIALRRRGYDVEGIDWARRTVDMVKQRFPDAPVRVGNVLRIAVPDDYYAGYISLGVVEHERNGPEPFFIEAFRVLKPAGIAIFTVPFVNLVRRAKAAFGGYRTASTSGEFYQYAFSKAEFVDLLRRSGFEIVTTGGYDSYKGIFDEFPNLKKLMGRHAGRYHVGAVVQNTLSKIGVVETLFGHMLLVVARKPGLPGAECRIHD